MKKYILAIFTLAAAFTASAQQEVLKITMQNGDETTIPVADIKEMTFDVVTPSQAELFAGQYTGTQTLVVGGMFTYTTELTYTLTAAADGTLTVYTPEYSVENTMMGDLTLGALTITGLEYDEAKGGFYRMYANDGLTQHFKAEKDNVATMDSDYPLGGESNILIKLDGNTITVENPFKLGAMPLTLTASFTGSK